MSTGNIGSMPVALQVKKRTFLDDEVQLKVLSKELGKSSKAAIAVLVEALESTDQRIKMQAAIKIIEFDVEVKKTISSDQIQRIIAEIRIEAGSGVRELEIENKVKRPVVNFSEIRSID